MEYEEYRDPWAKHPYLLSTNYEVDWKGTPGVGDILFGLNSVHMLSHLANKRHGIESIKMNVYWEHSEDHLHHCEDPETIIERCEYIHSFYHNKDAVKVNHIFNNRDKELWRIRHRGFRRKVGETAVLDGLPSWVFRKDVWTDAIPNKVVFWRPLFNAEMPRGWKRVFRPHDWERIIDTLHRKGFQTTELTYRTPVREAMYHIRTCRFCIFYDGMWQYIARNLCKPVIVLGDNYGIMPVHNPQGVFFYDPKDNENSLWKYLDKMPGVLEHMDRRVNKYKDFILGELNV